MTTRLKWMTVAIGTAVIASTLALWFLWLGPEPRVLIVGSTTTTQDTGLLDVLQGEYTRQNGRPLRIVVAGGGALLTPCPYGDLVIISDPTTTRAGWTPTAITITCGEAVRLNRMVLVM